MWYHRLEDENAQQMFSLDSLLKCQNYGVWDRRMTALNDDGYSLELRASQWPGPSTDHMQISVFPEMIGELVSAGQSSLTL